MANQASNKSYDELRTEEINKAIRQGRKYLQANPAPDGNMPITTRQLKFLRSYGRKLVDNLEVLPELTREDASKLIDKIHSEKITPKQSELLINRGYSHDAVKFMSKLQASIAISKLTRMTPAQSQALENSGIRVDELRKQGVYLSRSEASAMINQLYQGS